MNRLPSRQKGASAIATIILLVVLGYAVYIGIQYVPHAIESKSIDSILSNIETEHITDPSTSDSDAETRVIKLLQINEMNDMTEYLSVKYIGDQTTITFSYDRELDLIYKKHVIHYEKSLVLK